MSEELDEFKSELWNQREEDQFGARIDKALQEIMNLENSVAELRQGLSVLTDEFEKARERISYLEMVAGGKQTDNYLKCKACGHNRNHHQSTDKMGCAGIADYDRETNAYDRCHCREWIDPRPAGFAGVQNSGKRDYSKCICSMAGMPQDFNADPECPIHGDPKVLAQLAPREKALKYLKENPTLMREDLDNFLPTVPREMWGIPCEDCEHAIQAHYSPGGCAGNHPDGGQCKCQIFKYVAPPVEATKPVMVNSVADEIYAILEANSRFMSAYDATVLAGKIKEIWKEVFPISRPPEI